MTELAKCGICVDDDHSYCAPFGCWECDLASGHLGPHVSAWFTTEGNTGGADTTIQKVRIKLTWEVLSA